jgi:hypothetical protein
MTKPLKKLSPKGFIQMKTFLVGQMAYWEEEGNSGDVAYIESILEKLHKFAEEEQDEVSRPD